MKKLNEEEILLEIALTADEKIVIEDTKVADVYFCAIPLPITRIKTPNLGMEPTTGKKFPWYRLSRISCAIL